MKRRSQFKDRWFRRDGSLAPKPPNHYLRTMISVEQTSTEVRITIPRDAMAPDQLSSFLDWLAVEEACQKSQLTERDADTLADEIKSTWWRANRERFIPAREL